MNVPDYNLFSVVDGLISYKFSCYTVAATGAFRKYTLLKFCVSLYFVVKGWINVENLTSSVLSYFHSYKSKSYKSLCKLKQLDEKHVDCIVFVMS